MQLPDGIDATRRRVAAAQVAAAARAYGYEPSLPDSVHRQQHPGEWCECDHHTTTHHGKDGDGACADCGCLAFRRA